MDNLVVFKRLQFFKLFFLLLAYTLGRLTLGINQNYIHLFFVTLVILHTPLLNSFRSLIGKFSPNNAEIKFNPFFALISSTLFFLLYYLRLPSWISIPRFDQSVLIFILFIIFSKSLRLSYSHTVSFALFMLVISASSQIFALPHIGITTASVSYLLIGLGLIQYTYEKKIQG